MLDTVRLVVLADWGGTGEKGQRELRSLHDRCHFFNTLVGNLEDEVVVPNRNRGCSIARPQWQQTGNVLNDREINGDYRALNP